MTTYIAYDRNPFHQGSRSRTGEQVDRQFVADLLQVLGDCRLFWLPNLTDTTTSASRAIAIYGEIAQKSWTVIT